MAAEHLLNPHFAVLAVGRDETETDETFREKMEEVYKEVHEKKAAVKNTEHGFQGAWKGLSPRYSFTPVATGVPVVSGTMASCK